MDNQQKHLIRDTFAQVERIAAVAAALFYGRLFEIAPETQTLFRFGVGTLGMAEQGAKLMQTLKVAVAHLDNLGALVPALEALACRHVAYGVEAAHYDSVGAALLWTLEQVLGEAFTPEAERAWAALYTSIAGTMKRAAYGEHAGSEPAAVHHSQINTAQAVGAA
jgi:hemoglobin-like flavoprotein